MVRDRKAVVLLMHTTASRVSFLILVRGVTCSYGNSDFYFHEHSIVHFIQKCKTKFYTEYANFFNVVMLFIVSVSL